ETCLGREFDLEKPRGKFHILRLKLAYHHADFAIRDVTRGVFVGIYLSSTMIPHVDHFVSVDDLLGAHRFRNFSVFLLRKLYHWSAKSLMYDSINRTRTMRHLPHWSKNLPLLNIFTGTRVEITVIPYAC